MAESEIRLAQATKIVGSGPLWHDQSAGFSVSASNGHHQAVTPQRVVRVLWRRKVVCLVVAGVVFLAGIGWLVTRHKVYESSSSVALLPDTSDSGALPDYPSLISSLIPTYVQLVSSPRILDRVATSMGSGVSAASLAGEVHAESLSNAAVVTIVAQSPDPVMAQRVAAKTTVAFVSALTDNGVVVPQVYSSPTVPDQPSFPKIPLSLAAITVLALVLGLASGLAWDSLDPR